MTRSWRLSASLLLLLAVAACFSQKEPVIDRATVVAKHASVRLKNTVTSRTVITLEPGETVDILERVENWYRIRTGDIQGFMEETTVMTEASRGRIQAMAAKAANEPVQNTARLNADANLRIEAGRNATAIRKLPTGTKVEVFERKAQPRPGSTETLEAWLRVRAAQEVGWVLGNLLTFDVPETIASYTEGQAYTAIKPLKEVDDAAGGHLVWYVIAERSSRLDPVLDFDGIRVFTWSVSRHRYETAFRVRKLRGVYPLNVGTGGENPTFSFSELAADGVGKKTRDFVMRGTNVREIRSIR